MDLIDVALLVTGILCVCGMVAVVVIVIRKGIRISKGMDDIFRP